jgi:DNA-binding NarL/FixJ family response regulator
MTFLPRLPQPDPTPKNYSVMLVDDDSRFRQGVKTLLELYPAHLDIVAEAESAEQALKLLVQHRPNLILLDLELKDSSGMAFLQRLRELLFPSQVLVLSAHEEDEWVFRAMQSGAVGYVFKHRLGTQLFDAIATLQQSGVYLPPEVANSFFRLFQTYERSRCLARQRLQLTGREQDILQWLAKGASNDEIAKHLHVTVATVKAHLTSIFEKLQVTSRTQAIVAIFKLGLVQT